MSILLGHTARQTNQVASRWGVGISQYQILMLWGGLSRHKVSVGEPADGSPPFIRNTTEKVVSIFLNFSNTFKFIREYYFSILS